MGIDQGSAWRVSHEGMYEGGFLSVRMGLMGGKNVIHKSLSSVYPIRFLQAKHIVLWSTFCPRDIVVHVIYVSYLYRW